MLILGIETATVHASVAVVEDGVEISAWRAETKQDLLRKLAFEAQSALARAGRRFVDVGLIAVGLGPGSFTSVRVGVGTAKGFALARQTPLVGVSSLEAMAWRLRSQVSGLVCPVMDAKRGEVYTALYRVRDGTTEPVEKESVDTADNLMTRITALGEPVKIVGDAEQLSPQDVARFGEAMWPEPVWPEAAAIAEMGLRRFSATGGDEIAPLRPIYVRMSYAEESRKLDLGLR